MMEKALLQKSLLRAHGQLPGSLELAYLGDAIFEVYVRANLVSAGGRMKHLHGQAIRKVCAGAQAKALDRVEVLLTEEEKAVVRRARNAHQHPPKNADPAAYHRATGLEALIGYLALSDRLDRLDELVRAMLGENDMIIE